MSLYHFSSHTASSIMIGTLRNKMLFRTNLLVLFYLLACNAVIDAKNGMGLDAENDAEVYDVFKDVRGLVSIPVQHVQG